jgi:hypothetical protein
MKKIALYFIVALFSITTSWGMAVGLSIPDALERADIIAHIRIEDDVEIMPAIIRTKTDDGKVAFSTNSTDPEKYRKIATASLIHTFKAPQGQDKIKIRHTNGYVCPNVRYQKGKEYIVFLRKEADSDHYVTMNFYAGQFKIEEGQVVAFYLMPGYKHPDDLRLPYGRVSVFLNDAIQKQNG